MSQPSWVYDCSEVQLPSGVTGLVDRCFYYCQFLTSVTLPVGVTSLGNECFYYCNALTSITLPESIVSLGEFCFYSCESLTSITLPESVTSLGHNCFNGCTSLTLATVLPAIPPSLGLNVFNNVHTTFNIKVQSPYVDAYKTATRWSAYADKISGISEEPVIIDSY